MFLWRRNNGWRSFKKSRSFGGWEVNNQVCAVCYGRGYTYGTSTTMRILGAVLQGQDLHDGSGFLTPAGNYISYCTKNNDKRVIMRPVHPKRMEVMKKIRAWAGTFKGSNTIAVGKSCSGLMAIFKEEKDVAEYGLEPIEVEIRILRPKTKQKGRGL